MTLRLPSRRVLEQLTDRRTDLLLAALCVGLLLAGFGLGRVTVDDSPPALATSTVEVRESGDLPPVVVPSPIPIPARPPR